MPANFQGMIMDALNHTSETDRRTQRLDARVTAEDKRLLARAAELAGMNVSSFVVSHARSAAREIIREHETMDLTDRDREVLVSALLEEDPLPNPALQRAARTHDAYTGRT